MHPVFADFMDRFTDVYTSAGTALEGLPQEAVDWVPAADMNSLAVLVAHTCGAQRYWVGDVASGDPAPRDRDAEFRTMGRSAAELQKLLADTLAYTASALDQLAPDDLADMRVSPNHPDRRFSVTWSILHGLEHSALHLGHMQMVRQMWDQR